MDIKQLKVGDIMGKSNTSKRMHLRKVNIKDCDLIFNWANESEVRKNSFSSEPIMYKDHVAWFYNKINNKNSYAFILVNRGKDIGVVYLDVVKEKGIISYSIAKEFRGQGHGFNIIRLLEENVKLYNLHIQKLYGEVKQANIVSQKIFDRLGYEKSVLEDKIVYEKTL